MDLITTNQNLVTLDHEAPATTSLKLAEVFGKRHDHVMRDIQEVVTQLENLEDTLPNFGEPDSKGKFNVDTSEFFRRSVYADANGDGQPMYFMTEEGFALVALGYTGEKAFAFKVAYVKAFKLMRRQLEKLQKENMYSLRIELARYRSVPRIELALKNKDKKLWLDDQHQKLSDKLSREYGTHYSKIMNQVEKWVSRVHKRTNYKHIELSQVLALLEGHARFDEGGNLVAG